MNLLSKVGSPKELNAAWNKVRKGAKKSSSGLDGDTIYEFGASRESNLKLIANELSSGKFKFTNLKGVPIAKSSTKKRLIASPSIRDRVVQKSIENIITPFIKDKYEIDNESNFGYLEGLGVKDAALAIAKHRRHYPIVLQCDLADFFNTVDKDTLLKSLIYPLLPDTSLNNLLEDLFNLEIGNKAQLKALGKWEAYFPEALNGLPQGVSLSPVFSNIYLNCLDIELPKLGDYKLVRYADDFIVMCKSKESAQNAFKQVEAIVSERLKLTLHPLLAEGEAMERDKKYQTQCSS
jgi:RNA-directed DNA polymerase